MQAVYESDKLLAEYLLFHFGTAADVLPSGRAWPAGMHSALDFAVRTVSHFSQQPAARGLDLGCAVGRSAWEMARHCDEVIGIDFSHAFIAAAERLRTAGAVPYVRHEEGHVSTPLVAHPPVGIDGARIRFEQGDAMHLRADLGSFDRVHAANLLCRLPEPLMLLEKFPTLVRAGGELVLATPCTWLEEFTPRDRWPAGTTRDWLRSNLLGNFDCVAETEEPFLIRETARKFQWSSSLVTVWRRHAC